jgi:hypothetical protein
MSRTNFGLPSESTYTIVKHPKKERDNCTSYATICS